MITTLNYHSTYPSYFYITEDADIANLPKDCKIDSRANNIVDKSEWVVVNSSTDATKKAWHKIGTTTEIII